MNVCIKKEDAMFELLDFVTSACDINSDHDSVKRRVVVETIDNVKYIIGGKGDIFNIAKFSLDGILVDDGDYLLISRNKNEIFLEKREYENEHPFSWYSNLTAEKEIVFRRLEIGKDLDISVYKLNIKGILIKSKNLKTFKDNDYEVSRLNQMCCFSTPLTTSFLPILMLPEEN